MSEPNTGEGEDVGQILDAWRRLPAKCPNPHQTKSWKSECYNSSMFKWWGACFSALLLALPASAKPLCKVNSEDLIVVECAAYKGKYPPWPGPCLYGYEKKIGEAIGFNGDIYWPQGQGTPLSHHVGNSYRVDNARGALDTNALLQPCIEAHKTKYQNNAISIPGSFGVKLGTPMFADGTDEPSDEIELTVAEAEAQGRLFIAPPRTQLGRKVASGTRKKRIEFESANSQNPNVEVPVMPQPEAALAKTPPSDVADAGVENLAAPSTVEYSKSSAQKTRLDNDSPTMPQLPIPAAAFK